MAKESFMDKMVREITLKIQKDLEKQEEWYWGIVERDLKDREDIKNGEPVYFKGFVNKLTNG